MSDIKKHDRVKTTVGIVGTVLEINAPHPLMGGLVLIKVGVQSMGSEGTWTPAQNPDFAMFLATKGVKLKKGEYYNYWPKDRTSLLQSFVDDKVIG